MLARTRRNAVTTAMPGTLPVPSPLIGDLAEREERVDERGDEEADRELARLVPQDALDDPRRELAHRELDDDHRDRQHERGEAHHRGGDGRKDVGRRIRAADDARRHRLVVEVAVDGDRCERESGPGEHAEHGDEPEARLEMDQQLAKSHGDATVSAAKTSRRAASDQAGQRRPA